MTDKNYIIFFFFIFSKFLLCTEKPGESDFSIFLYMYFYHLFTQLHFQMNFFSSIFYLPSPSHRDRCNTSHRQPQCMPGSAPSYMHMLHSTSCNSQGNLKSTNGTPYHYATIPYQITRGILGYKDNKQNTKVRCSAISVPGHGQFYTI